MQRKMKFLRRSEDEEIKEGGLTLDFDEIARKGAISKEEKNIAKWYGIYSSRQPGNHMARVVVPGGVITSSQARNIARVSEEYGMGILSVTTRQSIQFHWLKTASLADIIRELAKEGSTTKHGCGDVNRNVAACPLAETCAYRRFNVRPFARETAKLLSDAADLENLPRKFKITFSGCPAGCAQPYINCLGAIAVQRTRGGKTEQGFKVVIGGGMGWKAFVAQELFSFVPAEKITHLSRAVALLFRDHGDRFNRAKARLKFVVDNKGIDFCRTVVLENLKNENVSIEDLEVKPFQETGPAFPERPLSDKNTMVTDGLSLVRAIIPQGELSHAQFRRIADLSEMYGNQKIYTTNRQNIELHGIAKDKLNAVKQEIESIGFSTTGSYGLTDIVPCVGTTYCPKAVTETRKLYKNLIPIVSKEKFFSIQDAAIINITGCPNSCSPYRIADIGFRGMRIREEVGSVEGYEMLIGGSQTDFGKVLGEFKQTDCPEVVETVLETFLKLREGEESLTACVQRIGLDVFKEAVYEI